MSDGNGHIYRTLVIDREKLRQLEAGFQHASENGLQEFEFDGHLLLTIFARYLIQYFRQRLEIDD